MDTLGAFCHYFGHVSDPSIMEKKIFLKLNEFETKIASTFSELRQNCEFADVTLVSEDGQEIEAHKVILSSSCPFS